MRLTKAERQALQEDILKDLPENYRIFSPYMWVWLIQIILVIFGGAGVTLIFFDRLSFGPELLFAMMVFVTLFFVGIPNILIAYGRVAIGIKYLRIVAKLYIVVALAFGSFRYPELISSLLAFVPGVLVLWITHTTRFQVFALHREKMAAWGRERMKKNKAFKEKIKENRRRAGKR